MILDPFSLITNAMCGQFLYHAGQVEESIDQFHATLDMESRFWVAHICLAKSFEKQGMYSEALTACDKAREFSGGNAQALSLAGYVHAVSGEKQEQRPRFNNHPSRDWFQLSLRCRSHGTKSQNPPAVRLTGKRRCWRAHSL
jgi:predicted Zn-dependent protease